MSHIFISYSRKDIDFAQKLVDDLTANNLEIWVDWKNIPPAEEWLEEIYHGIEASEALLFLISPNSLTSRVCNLELEHAVKNGKRIIPIIIREPDSESVPESLSKLNWIFYRDGQDDLEKAVGKICETIRTDYEWLNFHTRLQVKALEWDGKKTNDLLLRGKELEQAEKIFSSIDYSKEPFPTELQRKYLLMSREFADQQRNKLVGGIGIGSLILVCFCIAAIITSIVAWQQRGRADLETSARATAQANEEFAVVTAQAEKSRADEQTQIAIGNNIVVQAQEMEIVDVKLLLCIQGYKLSPSSEALSCIFDLINTNSSQGQIEIGLAKIGHFHENQITDLAISNSGEYLFAGSTDGVVSMWDLNNELSFIKNFPIQFNEITSLGVAPDSNLLAISDTDNKLVLLNTMTDEIVWEQKANDLLPINKLLLDNSGNIIITGGGNLDVVSGKKGEILFWSTSDGSLVGNQLKDLQYPVSNLSLSPDGQTLASGFYQTGGFDVLRFWDVESRSAISDSISAHSNAIVSLSFNPTGTILATGAISPGSASEGGDIILWDSHTFEPLWNLDDYPPFAGRMATKSSQITDMSFSSNGQFLFSNWGNGNESGVAVWDASIFELLNTYKYNSLFSVESLITSPDGLSLYAGMSNGEILELDISDSSFQPIQQLLDEDQTQTPEFASTVYFEDENTLLSSGNGGVITWDMGTKSGKRIVDENNIPVVPDEYSTEAISPDKKILAQATNDNSIVLIDIASSKQLVILQGHNDTIEKLAFTPDGKFLISTGFRDKIVLWDVYSYAKLLEHDIPVQFVDSISISPDSKYIAVALNTAPKFGGASEIILINIDFDLWIKTGCNISNRNFTEDEWSQYIGPEIPYQATCPSLPFPEE